MQPSMWQPADQSNTAGDSVLSAVSRPDSARVAQLEATLQGRLAHTASTTGRLQRLRHRFRSLASAQAAEEEDPSRKFASIGGARVPSSSGLSKDQFFVLLKLEGLTDLSRAESDALHAKYANRRTHKVSLKDFVSRVLPKRGQPPPGVRVATATPQRTAIAPFQKRSEAERRKQISSIIQSELASASSRRSSRSRSGSRPATSRSSGRSSRSSSRAGMPKIMNIGATPQPQAPAQVQAQAQPAAVSPLPPTSAAPVRSRPSSRGGSGSSSKRRSNGSATGRVTIETLEGARDLERQLLRKVRQLHSTEHMEHMFRMFAEDMSPMDPMQRRQDFYKPAEHVAMDPQQFNAFLLYMGLNVPSPTLSKLVFDKLNKSGSGQLVFNELRVGTSEPSSEEFDDWRRRLAVNYDELRTERLPKHDTVLYDKSSEQIMARLHERLRARATRHNWHSHLRFAIQNAFHSADVNDEGAVTRAEFGEVLRHIDCPLDDKYVQVLAAKFASPKDPSMVRYNGFIAELRKAFEAPLLTDRTGADVSVAVPSNRALPHIPNAGTEKPQEEEDSSPVRMTEEERALAEEQEREMERHRAQWVEEQEREAEVEAASPVVEEVREPTPPVFENGAALDAHVPGRELRLLPLTPALLPLIPEVGESVFAENPHVHNRTNWSLTGTATDTVPCPPKPRGLSLSDIPEHLRLNWSYNNRVGQPRPMSAYAMRKKKTQPRQPPPMPEVSLTPRSRSETSDRVRAASRLARSSFATRVRGLLQRSKRPFRPRRNRVYEAPRIASVNADRAWAGDTGKASVV